MFEKLYLLVKNNAGTAVVSNPIIPEKYHEAVMNDASSSIIEALKGQMEGGKLRDFVKYFQFAGVYNNPLISSAVRKFANKLNNFYNIEPAESMKIAKELVTPVMQEMIKESKSEKNKDFALGTLIAKLTGNIIDMNILMKQLSVG